VSVMRVESFVLRPPPTDPFVPLQGSVHLVPQGRSSAQVYPSSSSFLDKGASDSITRPSRHTCHCRRPLSRLFQATHFPLDNDTILSLRHAPSHAHTHQAHLGHGSRCCLDHTSRSFFDLPSSPHITSFPLFSCSMLYTPLFNFPGLH